MPTVRSVLNPASARGSVSFDSAVEQTAKKSVDWHAKVTNTTHSRSAKGALMSNTSGLRMPVLVTGAVLIAVVAFSLGLACNLLQDAPLAKVRLSGTEAGQAGHWLPASGPPGGGYYLHNSITDFFKIAKQAGTDKVTSHTYEDAYSKYFELMPRRGSVQRLFEIGLGCTMEYGPGASSKMWRQFLPQAEIWQAEYNSGCVESHKAKLKELGVKVVTGDQSDTDTLKRWITETGGRFDVIIDDGGHSNMQQYNSFLVLFEHALKPGGVYFIEDLQGARTFVDGDKKHIMIDIIKDWIEGLVMQPEDWVKNGQVAPYTPKFGLPPGIKFIDCANSICAITKCYEHDKRCVSPHTDPSLTKYSSKGTAAIGPGK